MRKQFNLNLNQYTGTERHHRITSIARFPVVTDGVIALATEAECFWLLHVIGSYQGVNKELDPEFQVWKLKVNHENNSAVLYGYNDETLIVEQKIPCTDFPLDEIKLYLIRNVIMLPSEY